MAIPADLDALRQFSARIGADPQLVQAAGGNTSVKDGDVMWIKASGTYLADAVTRDIMVPVDLPRLLDAVRRDDPTADVPAEFTLAARNAQGLRPSIETVVHAMMPHRIVIHVHCVETISLAIRRAARELIAARLAGIDWAFVPYRRPGLPLARAIAEVIGEETNVLVLGNHGLVVGADSVRAADLLLDRVSDLLRQPARPAPAPDLEALARLARDSDYRLPRLDAIHDAACDLASCRVAAGGSLYPDHVIYLGRGSVIAGPRQSAREVAAACLDRSEPTPAAILFPGKGVLIRADASPGVEPLALCLSLVAARVPEGTPLIHLSMDEESELLGWDAEKYRQALDIRGMAH